MIDSTTYKFTFDNGVVIEIPQAVAEKYHFGAQTDDAGIIECIGEAIGLSCCDVRLPLNVNCHD